MAGRHEPAASNPPWPTERLEMTNVKSIRRRRERMSSAAVACVGHVGTPVIYRVIRSARPRAGCTACVYVNGALGELLQMYLHRVGIRGQPTGPLMFITVITDLGACIFELKSQSCLLWGGNATRRLALGASQRESDSSTPP